jgi:hypothetical protein
MVQNPVYLGWCRGKIVVVIADNFGQSVEYAPWVRLADNDAFEQDAKTLLPGLRRALGVKRKHIAVEICMHGNTSAPNRQKSSR